MYLGRSKYGTSPYLGFLEYIAVWYSPSSLKAKVWVHFNRHGSSFANRFEQNEQLIFIMTNEQLFDMSII